MRQGRDLEEYVAARFAEKTGLSVRREYGMLRSREHPYMVANIDRRIVGEHAGLECKTTRLHYDFEDGQIPDWYYVQSVHYMAVRGYERYYIAVLDLSRMKFHWFKIERNEDEIKKLMDAERDFWEGHILPGIPPEADGSDADNKALASLFRKSKDNADDPVLLHDMDDAMDEYMTLGIRIKALQMEQDKIKQDIQLRLGENAYGGSGRFSVSWKASTSSRIDAKKLRERYPRVAEECSYESVSRRFNLSSK
jgi:predicted phage-related endonuclease